METYYISSNKYTTMTRQIKSGKVYDIRFRVITLDGVEKQKKLAGFKTKSAAAEAYTEFVSKFCKPASHLPSEIRHTAQSAAMRNTVKELYPKWIDTLGSAVKTATLYDYHALGKNYYIPMLGDVLIKDLSYEKLKEWQGEIWASKSEKTGNQLTPKYCKKVRGTFSIFLDWCAETYGTVNNLKNIKMPKSTKPKPVMDFWTKEEFEQFLSVADNPTMRTFFAMLFYTGRRKGEVMALTKKNISKNEIIFDSTYSRKTIHGEAYIINNTKNEKIGISPIANPLRAIMAEYKPADGEFYFGGEKPLSEGNIQHYFETYVAKSGVKKIRIHDLRHSFVSLLLHKNVNILVVADLIGDNPEQIMKTYGHLYVQDKYQAVLTI